MPNEIVPAADFQSLPLGFLISAPLKAAVEAQAIAAMTTKTFVETCLNGATTDAPSGGAGGADVPGPVRQAITVTFRATVAEPPAPGAAAGTPPQPKTVEITAPLLAILPVPYLQISEVLVNFKYSIAQTYRDQSETSRGIELKAGTGALLSPWVSASLSGYATSKAAHESSTNRSGNLEITVRAGQAPVPEGMARILSMLASGILAKPV